MSLEIVNGIVSSKCGNTPDEIKEIGIESVAEYKAKVDKMIEDTYSKWEKQKDEAFKFIKTKPESDSKLLESRSNIHNKAVQISKELVSKELLKTLASNTYFKEDFNRSAINFVSGLSKDENELKEISEAIKSKNTKKLVAFFKQGVERCKNVLNNSFNDRTDEERLEDIKNNYFEYKALAEMQPNQFENIVNALGIQDEVKEEADDWFKNYADLAVTVSMQRNYINLYSSPLYPDMGLDKMFADIPDNQVMGDNEEYDDFKMKYGDNALSNVMSELGSFKPSCRNSKSIALELADEEFGKSYDTFMKKSNSLMDEKGKPIQKEEFGKYMLSGKKVFVYDDKGNYLSSMKGDLNNMGYFKYDSKTIAVDKEEDFSIGMKDLKDLMGKSNPKRLEDPKKEYTQILNELNDLSSKNFSKEERDAKIKNIIDLSAKYMTEHKKTKGITGIGDKRRNAIETVYNSCKKLSDKLNKSKDKNIEKKQENVETRKSIIVDGAKTPEERDLQNYGKKSVTITEKLKVKATNTEQKFAEMMRQNAMNSKNGNPKASNKMGMKTK